MTQMASYDELLESIRAQFPKCFAWRDGRKLAIRSGKRMRLATEAFVAKLLRANIEVVEEQGKIAQPEALLEATTGIAAERLHDIGLRLPPSHLKCDPVIAALGVDLVAADTVVDHLWAAGLDHKPAGRYLHLDCKSGHAIRALQFAMPNAEWVGWDRDRTAVAWASRHIEGATFRRRPALPPLDESAESFDGVVALEFADSLDPETLQAWLAEIGRLVRPGGFALLAVDGFAKLARHAGRQRVPIDELAHAYRALLATGRAEINIRGRARRHYGLQSLPPESFGVDWLVEPPAIGAGPSRRDIYLARRRASPSPRVVSIDIDGSVEATDLASAGTGYGLRQVERVIDAGSVERRAPLIVDDRPVLPDLRRELAESFAERRLHHPAFSLLRFADALVVGAGSVVLAEAGHHRLLADSTREFFAFNQVPTGFAARSGSGNLALAGQIHRTIEPCCLLLQRPWSENFGHWLVDHAMALSHLVAANALPTRHIIVTKTRQIRLRQAMRQTIDAILPDAVVHEHDVEEIWQCRDLAYMMPVRVPAALEALRTQFLPPASRPSNPTRRLYILRPHARGRRLINEADLVQLSAQFGFEAVRPEDHSLQAQARMFAEAEAVIGVKGAALATIVFAPPTCRVIALSPGDFTDPSLWDIASVHHKYYAELFGDLATLDRPAGRNDFVIDASRFDAALRQMLAAP